MDVRAIKLFHAECIMHPKIW